MTQSFNIPAITESDGIPHRAAVKINQALSNLAKVQNQTNAAVSRRFPIQTDPTALSGSAQVMASYEEISQSISDQIAAINEAMSDLEEKIESLDVRLTILEQKES